MHNKGMRSGRRGRRQSTSSPPGARPPGGKPCSHEPGMLFKPTQVPSLEKKTQFPPGESVPHATNAHHSEPPATRSCQEVCKNVCQGQGPTQPAYAAVGYAVWQEPPSRGDGVQDRLKVCHIPRPSVITIVNTSSTLHGPAVLRQQGGPVGKGKFRPGFTTIQQLRPELCLKAVPPDAVRDSGPQDGRGTHHSQGIPGHPFSTPGLRAQAAIGGYVYPQVFVYAHPSARMGRQERNSANLGARAPLRTASGLGLRCAPAPEGHKHLGFARCQIQGKP